MTETVRRRCSFHVSMPRTVSHTLDDNAERKDQLGRGRLAAVRRVVRSMIGRPCVPIHVVLSYRCRSRNRNQGIGGNGAQADPGQAQERRLSRDDFSLRSSGTHHHFDLALPLSSAGFATPGRMRQVKLSSKGPMYLTIVSCSSLQPATHPNPPWSSHRRAVFCPPYHSLPFL